MDPLSLVVGFLTGAFTGAAGHYLGEKYTDERRSKDAILKLDTEWKVLESRFPKVIAEMKEDVRKPELSSVRRFFVKSKRTSVNSSEASFVYHTDEHPDISAAVAHLEELGYIEDITTGNCPLYRMRENFVDNLRSS